MDNALCDVTDIFNHTGSLPLTQQTYFFPVGHVSKKDYTLLTVQNIQKISMVKFIREPSKKPLLVRGYQDHFLTDMIVGIF